MSDIAEKHKKSNIKNRRFLAISYNRLGDIAKAQGRLEEARDYYVKCLEIRLALVEKTELVKAWKDLSISYRKLEKLAGAQGRQEDARKYHQKQLELL